MPLVSSACVKKIDRCDDYISYSNNKEYLFHIKYLNISDFFVKKDQGLLIDRVHDVSAANTSHVFNADNIVTQFSRSEKL